MGAGHTGRKGVDEGERSDVAVEGAGALRGHHEREGGASSQG